MTRTALIEYDQVNDPLVQTVYDEIISQLGFGIVPNLFKSMASRPGFLAAQWTAFRSTILEGSLPRTLKEMIGVVVSHANRSNYALNVHLHSLSVLGMGEGVLSTLVTDFANCPLPQREKAVIQFGLKAAITPHALTDADYAYLSNLGIDEDEVYEILATANLFTAVNQYTDAIALEIDSL